MALFRHRDRPAAPAAPAWPSRPATVAGLPVRVFTGDGSTCGHLDGVIDQPVIAVRPRQRPEPDPRVHPGAQAWLTVFDKRPREVDSGDPAFDARYVIQGATGLDPSFTLTEPVRELVLQHDVVVLVAQAKGAWVGVAHDRADQRAAEDAVLRLLASLVRA